MKLIRSTRQDKLAVTSAVSGTRTTSYRGVLEVWKPSIAFLPGLADLALLHAAKTSSAQRNRPHLCINTAPQNIKKTNRLMRLYWIWDLFLELTVWKGKCRLGQQGTSAAADENCAAAMLQNRSINHSEPKR
jgi:hypothetical protein